MAPRKAARAKPAKRKPAPAPTRAKAKASRAAKPTRSRRPGQRRETPIEYSLLLTATLCLLALGVVMVFSASSTTSLLGESGDASYYLKRTALFGVLGLLVMRVLSVRGLRVARAATPLLMAVSIFLLLVVLVPGVGIEVNGARRWLGAGLVQIQPSEVAKLALVLYAAQLLATRPKLTRSIGDMGPLLLAVGAVCALVVLEPDLGTAMVACFTAAAMLLVAGARVRDLALLGAGIVALILVAIAIEPYRMERLTGFISPGADPSGSGFQAIQAKIALGSGGLFGVGLGESLQKAFYLPEAHTDMIAAVIGEELGLVGILMVCGLLGIFAYAGLQTAKRARERYAKLLAAGLTALVLVQATINLFAVLGLAPLTGVPLPFVSYGNSSMLTLLAAVGLLLNIARNPGARLRVVEGGRSGAGARRAPGRSTSVAKGRDSRGRDRRTRSAGARRR